LDALSSFLAAFCILHIETHGCRPTPPNPHGGYTFSGSWLRGQVYPRSAFALLDGRGSLRLVTDLVHEDDALCLALTCRALRDSLWARFPRRAAGDKHARRRLRTRDAAVVATVARLVWVRSFATRLAPEHGCRAACRCLPAGIRSCWPQWLGNGEAAVSPLRFSRGDRLTGFGTGDRGRPLRRAGDPLSAAPSDPPSGADAAAACRIAARHGSLAALRWLRARGWAWNERTCIAAVREGGGGSWIQLELPGRLPTPCYEHFHA
jgi:hypothetical protein